MVDGVPVVAAPEEIDITNAPDLRSALLEAAAAANGHGTVVADLSRTQFCDSSGLHTLLAAHKRATAAGGDVLLVLPGNAVLRVFTITGVDQIIPNFTSLETTLAQTSACGSNGRADRTGRTVRSAIGEPMAGLKGSRARAESTKEPADRGRAAGPSDVSARSPGNTGS
jgi:anti-sigma B factor antagonist